MTRVKAVPVLQASKAFGLTGLMLGAISSCIGLLVVFVVSTESPIVTLTALVSLPVIGAVTGFGGAALLCWTYNSSARWLGGLRLELEEETVATRSTAEGVGGPSPSDTGTDDSRGGAPDRRGWSGLDRERQSEAWPVRFCRLKLGPTPAGGLSPGARPSADWVDVHNDGASLARTGGLCLYHLEQPGPEAQPEYRFIVTLPECTLKPDEVLRLHSGPRRDLMSLRADDRNGADWHAFTGGEVRFFNRREGDTVLLYAVASRETIDAASFDPDPPEGVILFRQGDKLVSKPVTAAAGRP